MLTIWNPFAPVSKNTKSDRHMTAGDYFDRLFQSTFDEFFSDLYSPYKTVGISSKENDDGTVTMYIDVPGIKEKDISIELIDNLLKVNAERKDKGSYYAINKSFTIPENYDVNSLRAELNDGVLSLIWKKKPVVEKEVKKIEVMTSKALPEKNE